MDMQKYEYLTESISYSFSKKNLVSKLQELLKKELLKDGN